MSKFVKFVGKNSGIILAIASSIGVAVTAFSAAKSAKKSILLEKEATETKGEELTTTEKIKIIAPAYILTGLCGASTIFCIVASAVISKKQYNSLAAAYTLLSSTYMKYKEEVTNRYGEKEHQDIVSSIANKPIHISERTNVFLSSCNSFFVSNTEWDDDEEIRLFYDTFSDRYFESTVSKVLLAEFHLNRNYVLRGLGANVNEFYEFLGLEPIDGGNDIGWCSVDEIRFIDFNHFKMPLEDKPVEGSNNYLECYAIEFYFEPSTDYLFDMGYA